MGKRIRILLLIGQLRVGGAQRQLILLAKNLDKLQYDVQVCTLSEDNELLPELQEAEIKVHVLERIIRPDITRMWRLYKVVKEFRPDIIHSYLFTANMWGRIVGRMTKTPTIISERNALVWKPWWQMVIDRFLKSYQAVLIANSSEGADLALMRGEVDGQKIIVVHNGVDVSLQHVFSSNSNEVFEKTNQLDRGPVIGLVGSLDPKKNHESFFKIISMLKPSYPDIVGVCLGDGPRRLDLENIVKQMSLDMNVRFLGKNKDVASIMRVFDVLVITSKWEGLPNVLLEAMLQKRPVVATNVGGIPDVIRNGKNGFMFDVGCEREMADCIIRLLRDRDLASQVGEAGYNTVITQFSVERMVNEIQKCYNKVLACHSHQMG